MLRIGADPPWTDLANGASVRPPKSDAEQIKLSLIRREADGDRFEILDEAPELPRDASVESLKTLVGALFGARPSKLLLRVATLTGPTVLQCSQADLGAELDFIGSSS